MKRHSKITQVVMATLLGTSVAAVTTHTLAKPACAVEKCYGIAKKAKNDCGTPKHACAAQSKKDGAKSEWIFVMKGNCDRIVGGSLTAPGSSKTKK